MNLSRLKTVIIAPLTSTIRESFPTRVKTACQGKQGQVALDQLRAIARTRIIKKLGCLDKKLSEHILNILAIMFQA
jgi:mRNA interferase MazF